MIHENYMTVTFTTNYELDQEDDKKELTFWDKEKAYEIILLSILVSASLTIGFGLMFFAFEGGLK